MGLVFPVYPMVEHVIFSENYLTFKFNTVILHFLLFFPGRFKGGYGIDKVLFVHKLAHENSFNAW